jgi:hypothetical protein
MVIPIFDLSILTKVFGCQRQSRHSESDWKSMTAHNFFQNGCISNFVLSTDYVAFTKGNRIYLKNGIESLCGE